MELTLWKKPKNVRIVAGYPGFGLVGTITTGFLVDHLNCERIGTGFVPEMPATLAIHEGKVIHPIDIYYAKDYNLVLLHSIVAINTVEWKAADMVLALMKDLSAKEIVTIEGVAGQQQSSGKTFYHTTQDAVGKKLSVTGAQPLKEGIIMGLSSALIIKNVPAITCLFAETSINLPDSKAAAKMIELLDKYMDLDVDYKPLLKQAQEFEERLKTLLEQRKVVAETKEKHEMNYIS